MQIGSLITWEADALGQVLHLASEYVQNKTGECGE